MKKENAVFKYCIKQEQTVELTKYLSSILIPPLTSTYGDIPKPHLEGPFFIQFIGFQS